MSLSIAVWAQEADHTNDVLEEIRREISANDDDLREARARRDVVLSAARSFKGALRTFKSGSVAHGTVNNPVNDADGGVVLDRRVHVALGPDSATQRQWRPDAAALSGPGHQRAQALRVRAAIHGRPRPPHGPAEPPQVRG